MTGNMDEARKDMGESLLDQEACRWQNFLWVDLGNQAEEGNGKAAVSHIAVFVDPYSILVDILPALHNRQCIPE